MDRYQISFIYNNQIKKVDFKSTGENQNHIYDRLKERIGDHVQDLQVFKPNSRVDSVVDVFIEIGDEIYAEGWRKSGFASDLIGRAGTLDWAAEMYGEYVPVTVELIWLEGGGEDYAFGATMNIRPQDGVTLKILLGELLEDAHISDPKMYVDDVNLETLPLADEAIELALKAIEPEVEFSPA